MSKLWMGCASRIKLHPFLVQPLLRPPGPEYLPSCLLLKGIILVINRARRKLLGIAVPVLAAFTATLGVAYADNGTTSASAVAAAGEMPYAVEDFNYPGAAQIQEQTGALLKRGDGHMLMTACDGTEDILIQSRTGQKQFCFDVAAKPAFLTLEIPQAYGIWTSADPVKTTIREDDGTTTVVNAPANDFTGYGEAGASGDPTMLIELRVTA
ncbi:hypothetical protein ACFXAZ_38025 [Streptomyces sp. NPDC059477]|uniref:hypothetical protein n=1 Tax=Streptomyces sp. NPDC059477 TaxID=3346847 RepID=UPI0036B7F796